MAKVLALFFLVLTFTLAQTPSIKELKDYPKSLAKDFYIWHYLHGRVNPSQADKLFAQTHHVGKKLYKAYAKKSNNKYIKKSLKCFNLSGKQLLKNKDINCVLLSLSPSKAIKMGQSQRKKLIKRLRNYAPTTVRWLKALNSKQNIEVRFKESPEDFLMLFRKSGQRYRRRNFNQQLSHTFIDTLSKLNAFNYFIESVATSYNRLLW